MQNQQGATMTATTSSPASSVSELERLKTLHNGSKQPLTFTDAEFERRLGGLRTIMAEKNLDAVVLTSYHNIKYYSDYLFTYFGRSYALVVTADDSVSITANIDAGMPWRTSYGDNIVYTDWRRDNFYFGIQEALRRRGIKATRLGVEDDTLPVLLRDKLQAAFPDAALTDISQAAMRQRMIKSAEEIEVIKHGARIGDLGGEAIKAAIAEGITEYEVALIGTEAMVHEIARTFPDQEVRDTWVWFQSGINTDGAHNWATTRKLQRGDILSLNCFPMTSGYYTALERTLFLGEPDARSLELWNVNVEVHERGLELIKPGAVCKDIAAELNEIYISHNLLPNRTFGYGHSFGVLSHYYGREAGLELREDIDTVLEPGMVVSMEPMITVADGQPGAGGYREHDILVISENGAENITKFGYGPNNNIINP
jgi:creatinase